MENHSAASSCPTELPSLKDHWSSDLLSGFIVFLLALPLSVGIAVASGAPPTAGLLAAIVGGLVGSFIRGSHVPSTDRRRDSL